METTRKVLESLYAQNSLIHQNFLTNFPRNKGNKILYYLIVSKLLPEMSLAAFVELMGQEILLEKYLFTDAQSFNEHEYQDQKLV